MSRIIITADSTADIPAEIAQKYNIRISPLHVLYDDEDYADGVDITPEYIIERYEERDQLSSTSAVTPEEYRLFFKQILREGYDEIVHIPMSSELSGTCNNARQLALDFDGRGIPADEDAAAHKFERLAL